MTMAVIVGGVGSTHVPAIGKAIAEKKHNDPYWKPFRHHRATSTRDRKEAVSAAQQRKINLAQFYSGRPRRCPDPHLF
jgi:hypothetical protein